MAEAQVREVKTLNTRIKLKRDTEANWISNNPVILYGEIIFVEMSDGSVKAKVGDGIKKYNELPFSDKALQDALSSLDAKVEGVDDRVDDANTRIDGVDADIDEAFEQISAINQALPGYANQHAFSKIVINNTNIDADAATDLLTITAGNNISITPDAVGDKITFSVADGNTSTKGVVKLTDSIESTDTATAATPNSVKQAYDKASTAIEQISALDQDFNNFIEKTLPGYTNQHAFSRVVVNSTNINADTATDALTIVAGNNISITPDTTNDKITFSVANGTTSTKGVVQLTDSTTSTSTSTAATPNSVKLAFDKALTAEEKAAEAIGVANSKADAGHTHSSFGSSLSAGSATQPIYLNAGVPTNTTYKLEASVPSNAKFTDTTYDLAASTSSTNGNVKINLTAGGSGSGTDSVTIKGSGATTVTTDANGVVTISSTDNDTKYTHPTTAGNKHIPSGGTSGQILVWSADGTAAWGNNSPAYSLPMAGQNTLGGVKTTSTVTSTSGLTACPIISGVPYYKDTNNTYTLSSFGVTASAAELNAAASHVSDTAVHVTAAEKSAWNAMGSSNLTLGTTSSTAYRGDYGNTAYLHSQAAHAPSNAQKNSDITKAEIEAKLTGTITSHSHNYAASSHTSDTTAHITAAERTAWNNKTSLTIGTTSTTAAAGNHTHSGYAAASHTHDYAASGHTHDDRYYTESEIDSKLSGKSDTGHTHNYAVSSHTHSEYASSSHTHAYLPTSGGTLTGQVILNSSSLYGDSLPPVSEATKGRIFFKKV